MKRLSSLDYLRGLAAFGIMVFHYSMWTYGLFSSQDFLGRIGIYDVPVFYVLSGLTLYHVYFDKIGGPSGKGLADFVIKRVFRIYPLLWLVSLVTLTYTHEVYTRSDLFLNFSGLFSVHKWDNTVAYGAWSIGNELCFYLFFPVFIFLSKKARAIFALLAAGIFVIYLWFAFIHIDHTKTLAEYWPAYTNPLNQIFLFLGGYLMGLWTENVHPPRWLTLSVIAACLLAFIFLPVRGDSILLVTGINRLIFTAICFLVCFSFYKTDFRLPCPLGRMFSVLGEISYSVYLVHPITWHYLQAALHTARISPPPLAQLLIGFIFSLLVAYAVYRLYEMVFMKLGKRCSNRFVLSKHRNMST